jgi:predicted RND superfamily exporter protein
MAMVFSLVLLPALIVIFGLPKTRKTVDSSKSKINFSSERITRFILKYKTASIIATILIVVFSIVGIQKIWINSSFLDKFESNSEIVKTDTFVNSHFGGTSTINVILESTEKDAFKQPENLLLIDKMQYETEKLQKVGNSFSLADYIKRMHKVMNEDKDEYYAIPDNSDMVAQYLLLYEMSGDPENLAKVANYDYTRTNINFQLKGDDSKTINEAIAVIAKFKDDFNKQGINIAFAGSGYKALVFTDLILEGQIQSLLISLILCIVLLALMFRSFKAGLIGSVPIFITAFISFGIMGLFDIPLSTTTALLSSIAIGIGIDYSIHFLEHYRANLKKTNDKTDSLIATIQQAGKAIMFNAIVVIAGFMVLLFSVFPPNRTLGALVSLNMFTSFIGTLTIMMVLVYVFNLFIKPKKAF